MRNNFLKEGSALDLLKDIEKDNTNVSPEDIAPELKNEPIDGITYDSLKDPEQALNESVLKEGKSYDLFKEWLDNTDDGSFETFKNSEYYSQIGRNGGWDYDYFLKNLRWIRKDFPGYEFPPGTPLNGSASGRNAYSDTRDDDDAIYSRKGHEIDPDKISDQLKGWVQDYSDVSPDVSVDEIFEEMGEIVKNICLGRSDKRHALIAGDPGIGKTYTVKEIIKKYLPEGKKLSYESGDIGANLTSLVPFIFYHRDNEIIILDDNDKILKKECDTSIKNFMKAVLDPDAPNKPVSVRANQLRQYQNGLDALMDEDANLKESYTPTKEGHLIEIDEEALYENRLVVKVDGLTQINESISAKDAHNLSNMVRPCTKKEGMKLHEALIDDDFNDDDDFIDNGDEDTFGDSFPRKFVFNSSVVFISNLEFKQIDPANLDRCESVEIKLNLEQFMGRLSSVLGGLCKGSSYSTTPQFMRDWAKKCVYVVLQGVVEAFYAGVRLFSQDVIIRRKFTFRMFEEFCVYWIRHAFLTAEKKNLDLSKQSDLDIIAKEITGKTIVQKILPWISKRTD